MTGKDVGEIHQDIATFVNKHFHVGWTKQDAWVYIQYIKSKYNQAVELSKSIGTGDTDEIKLRNDVLCICPHYDVLQKVYGTPPQKLPTPPVKLGSTS
ncbi:hypothetical protein BGX34_007500, partial [Mortierella sp. NVP85]